MTKDYFQDIIPPQPDSGRVPSSAPVRQASQNTYTPSPQTPQEGAPQATDSREEAPMAAGDRSIRNIMPSPARRMAGYSGTSSTLSEPPRSSSGRGMRVVAMGLMALLFLGLIGALALFGLRSTTVTITPRTHPVTFDETSVLTALPVAMATGTQLTYTVKTFDFEDSEPVAAQGVAHAERKASGSITVVNEYQTSPVKLVKNTRFQTPDGLIFRAPADIVIPAMTASAPGKVEVMVVADEAGEKYNVGPVSKLTLPGLKSGSPMYQKVYGMSSSPMSGGFVGDEPAVAPAALSTAVSSIRARLEQKVRESLAAENGSSSVAFAEAARITYQDAPSTTEPDKSVRVHQKAHVEVPVFDAAQFAHAIANSVSADAEQSSIALVGQQGYSAQVVGTSTVSLGSAPITVALSGKALLVWDIDTAGVASALAGKDGAAFKTIVTGFPGVEEAHARIEPFWSKTFPKTPSDIKIVVEKPQNGQ